MKSYQDLSLEIQLMILQSLTPLELYNLYLASHPSRNSYNILSEILARKLLPTIEEIFLVLDIVIGVTPTIRSLIFLNTALMVLGDTNYTLSRIKYNLLFMKSAYHGYLSIARYAIKIGRDYQPYPINTNKL